MNAKTYLKKAHDPVYIKIFEEMARRIGMKLEDIKLVKDGDKWEWPFYRYEWTEEEEADFRKWLKDYIYKHRKELELRYSKTIINRSVVPMFLLNYSWKYKCDKTEDEVKE